MSPSPTADLSETLELMFRYCEKVRGRFLKNLDAFSEYLNFTTVAYRDRHNITKYELIG